MKLDDRIAAVATALLINIGQSGFLSFVFYLKETIKIIDDYKKTVSKIFRLEIPESRGF